MQDVLSYLSTIKRPRLLVRAARIGAQDYRRDVHLQPILNCQRLPKSGEALMRLSQIETELNSRRLNDDASYSFAQHIDVLIALVAEARFLKQTNVAKST